MDLAYTPEEQAFREEVRAWINQHLDPALAAKVRNGLRLERDDIQGWAKILGKKGWLAYGWPQEFGGPGWGAVQKHRFAEELARAGAPAILPFGPVMVAPVIMAYGTPEQQKRFLPGIASGEVWWSQGYSEPGSGSDLASVKTRAERQGDHYLVNGQKTWTTLGQHGDWIFNLVRTSNEGKPQTGISFLLIDMKSPGVTVRPIKLLDGECEVNEVFFDNVTVPADQLIGQENKGWTYAKHLLSHEREAPGLHRQCQAQVFGRLLDTGAEFRQIEAVAGADEAFGPRIVGEIEHLRGRHVLAEKKAGGFRQLVRLVENHRVAGREELGRTFVAQHHVGKEQMVIDHHHVGSHGVASRREDEAVLVMRAVLAEAVVARRGDHRPHRRAFGHPGTLRFVAGARDLREAADALRVHDVLAGQETAFVERPFKVVMAKVIRPPLEESDLDRRPQHVAHGGQVAPVELVLQGLGAGRDDDLTARKKGRHKVGEGLAGARPGFGDEHRVVLQCGGDTLGHLELLRAHPVTRNAAGKQSVGGKDFGERRHGKVNRSERGSA